MTLEFHDPWWGPFSDGNQSFRAAWIQNRASDSSAISSWNNNEWNHLAPLDANGRWMPLQMPYPVNSGLSDIPKWGLAAGIWPKKYLVRWAFPVTSKLIGLVNPGHLLNRSFEWWCVHCQGINNSKKPVNTVFKTTIVFILWIAIKI